MHPQICVSLTLAYSQTTRGKIKYQLASISFKRLETLILQPRGMQ